MIVVTIVTVVLLHAEIIMSVVLVVPRDSETRLSVDRIASNDSVRFQVLLINYGSTHRVDWGRYT